MTSSPGIVRIHIGQVWRHHSTGFYTVYGLHADGSVSIRPSTHTGKGLAPDGGVNGSRVWGDYLRRNFEMYEEHA